MNRGPSHGHDHSHVTCARVDLLVDPATAVVSTSKAELFIMHDLYTVFLVARKAVVNKN